MPAIFAVISPILVWFTRFLVARFALALGVFVGSMSIMNQFFAFVQSKITELQGTLSGPGVQVFLASGALDVVAIMLAAYSAAMSIKGLRNLAPGA